MAAPVRLSAFVVNERVPERLGRCARGGDGDLLLHGRRRSLRSGARGHDGGRRRSRAPPERRTTTGQGAGVGTRRVVGHRSRVGGGGAGGGQRATEGPAREAGVEGGGAHGAELDGQPALRRQRGLGRAAIPCRQRAGVVARTDGHGEDAHQEHRQHEDEDDHAPSIVRTAPEHDRVMSSSLAWERWRTPRGDWTCRAY